MKALALSVCTLLFLGALAFSQVGGVSAQCADSNSASLALRSDSMLVNGDGTFLYVLDAGWNTKGTPFIGVMSQASGTINVTNITHLPLYFFPNSCEGEVSIIVFGRKNGPPGTTAVNHQLDLGPTPYNAKTLVPVLIP